MTQQNWTAEQTVARGVEAESERWTRWDVAWAVLIVLVGTAFSLFTMRAYAPGGYHSDGLFQLAQALGDEPWNDWHPVVMSVLWKFLIDLTGSIASLMYLQVALTWLATSALALILYDITRNQALSVFALVIPMLPWVANVIGMLWKDVHLMTALLVCVVSLFAAARYRRIRWLLIVFAVVFLLYAVLVRKNAFFAAVPLLWMVVSVAGQGNRLGDFIAHGWKHAVAIVLAALIALGGLSLISGKLVETSVGGVISTNQLTQVMLDDLLFTMTGDEIRAADIPDGLKEGFLASQEVCPPGGSEHITDAYWRCYGMGEHGGYTKVAYDDEIRELWFSWVPAHPTRYLEYRTSAFVRFLFATDYKIQVDNAENDYGLDRDHPQSHNAMTDYTKRFVDELGWTFDAWFWVIVLTVLLVAGTRQERFRREIVCLTASGLCYIVGYFPIVPANNYRYIYWPVVAGLVAMSLLWAGRALQRRHRPTDSDPVRKPSDSTIP